MTHLSALASETSHALLAPLPPHTGVDSHAHFEAVLVFDTVGLEGSSLKDIGAIHEADLVGRDELCVLDHELEALNRGGSIHFVRSRVDKDFHFQFMGQLGCST